MKLDQFVDLLRAHLAALQSSAWPKPSGPLTGPALFLDHADTEELIALLERLRRGRRASEGKAPPPNTARRSGRARDATM